MGSVRMGVPHEIVLRLARPGDVEVFIETGTYMGETTRWAARHFETVHTIERAQGLYETHSPALARIPRVTPHLGDSRDVLPRIVAEIPDRKAVFWLDGHWSGAETAGANDECPLEDELRVLAQRSGDIILIDDARLFLSAPPLPHDAAQWPTLFEIFEILATFRERPFVQVVDDVLFIIPDEPGMRACLVDYARERAAHGASSRDTPPHRSRNLHRSVRRALSRVVGHDTTT